MSTTPRWFQSLIRSDVFVKKDKSVYVYSSTLYTFVILVPGIT